MEPKNLNLAMGLVDTAEGSGQNEPAIRLKVGVEVLGWDRESPLVRALQQEMADSSRVVQMINGAQPSLGKHSYAKWTGGHWVLSILADFPYPAGDERLIPLRDQQLDWLFGERHLADIRRRFVNGRQRRCASQEGNALFSHLRLGIETDHVHELAQSLERWQWPDGGWNCDMNPQAHTSSFEESLIPLRGMIAYAVRFDDAAAWECARKAADVFLSRGLFRRLKDRSIIIPDFLELHYPCYWHYDILFALKVMAEGGWMQDSRCEEALELLEIKQPPDGGFPAEGNYTHHNATKSGYSLVDWGGKKMKKMNSWVTADALLVLGRAKLL